MTETTIRADGISKRFAIGRVRRHDTLRDRLSDVRSWLPTFGRGSNDAGAAETLWALNDVSFEVKQGEVVGVIGRNGAGKSTLLKVLSRITKPSAGRAEIHGRVGSLLEVGTGFHPELTGRENIFLNGAILGMHRAEIERKFDEIVAFAEVEKFIETPVKHYSSGMYVRLAFAVAAHLEPEILLVDEVLAVGDAAFQKKSLGKLGDVAREGRTVLFVSHNIAAITRICDRILLLDQGRLKADGPAYEVAKAYLTSGIGMMAVREWPTLAQAPGNDIVRLQAVRVLNHRGEISEAVDIRNPVGIEMDYTVLQSGHVLTPNFHLINEEGITAFMARDLDPAWAQTPRPAGNYTSIMWIPGNYLAEGTLVVIAALTTYVPFHVHFHERDTVAFQVIDSLEGNSARGDFAGVMPGIVRPLLSWNTERREPFHNPESGENL